MSDVGRHLVRGATARILALAIGLALGLVLTPMLVQHLGDATFGKWLLVANALGYFGLLDLGLHRATSRFVAKAVGAGDRDEAARYITASLLLFTLVGVLVLLVAGVMALVMRRFVPDPGEATLLRDVILVMGAAAVLTLPARVARGVLAAHLRYDLTSVIETITHVARAGAIVLVVYAGGGLLMLSVSIALILVVEGLVLMALSRRVHGPVGLSLRWVNRQAMRDLVSFGGWSFISKGSQIARDKLYPVIIPIFLGSWAAVAPFGVAAQLRTMLQNGMRALVAMLTPVFSQQQARGDFKAMRTSYLLVYKISCYLAAFGVGMLLLMSEAFMERWIGWRPWWPQAVSLLRLLLVGGLAMLIQWPTMDFLLGTGRQRYYGLTNAAEAVASILLVFLLVPRMGLVGLAWATVVPTMFIKTLVQPLPVCRSLGMSLWRYHVDRTLYHLAVVTVFLQVLYFAGRSLLVPSYPLLAAFLTGGTLLFGVYIFAVGFTPAERQLLLGSILPRRRPQPQPV